MELAPENKPRVWEKFTCDSCHRFLSVDPITLYPDERVICGRCPKDQTGGMIISIGSTADQLLFKCVNRFDGCRQLLTSDMVEEHEKLCVSKKYICPLCPEAESREFPTYLLMTHFKETHEKNILKNPCFSVNSVIDVGIFLYAIDDNLFFITFKSDYQSVFLNTLYVGSAKEASQIMQEFHVKRASYRTVTERRSCDCLSSLKSQRFYSVSRYEIIICNISFKLDLEEIESFRMQLSKMADSNVEKLQKIFLSPVVLNSNPQYSIDTTGTSLVVKEGDSESIVTFQCCICFVKLCGSTINTIESDRKSFCGICSEYYKTKEVNVQIKQFSVTKELQDNLQFFCKWNCGDMIPYSAQTIKHDEEFCQLHAIKFCPVEDCVFEGNSHDLHNHFETKHADAKLYLNSTTNTVVVHMDFTRGTFEKHSYFWMNNKFVLFKEQALKNKTIFSIKYCSRKYANDELQPAIIVYDTKYVGTFKNNFVYTKQRHNPNQCSFKYNIILEKARVPTWK